MMKNSLAKKPIITYFLIGIMVIYFIFMTFAGGTSNNNVLIEFGAEYNPLIKVGQIWRLITPIFIHIGYQHLILNMIVLYFLGSIIEKNYGHFRYLFIFLVSGIVGNLFSFAFENGVSAGSSTSIFGLFGAYFVLYLNLKNNTFIQNNAKTFLIFIILNFIFDLFIPSISIIGHLGGLIGGILISLVLGIKGFKTLNKKCIIFYANALIIVIMVLYYIGLYHLHK